MGASQENTSNNLSPRNEPTGELAGNELREKARPVSLRQIGSAVGDRALLSAVFGPKPGAPSLPPPLDESVTRSYGGAVNGPSFFIDRHPAA